MQLVYASENAIHWPEASVPLENLHNSNAQEGNISVIQSTKGMDDISIGDIQKSLSLLCQQGEHLNSQLIYVISDKKYFEDEDLRSVMLTKSSDPLNASGIEHRKWQEFAEQGWIATYQPETRWLVFRPWSGYDSEAVQLEESWCN